MTDDDTDDEPPGETTDSVADEWFTGDVENGDRGPAEGSDAVPGGERGDEPLGNLADRLERRHDRDDAESDDVFERAFDDVGVEEADGDALWENLEGGSIDTGVEAVEADDGEETYLLNKREYCQRCQFFSKPPETRCEYDGSEILEVDEGGEFKVSGCPIIEGVEDLQDLRK